MFYKFSMKNPLVSDLPTSLIWGGQSRSGLRALNWLWRWQRAKIPYLTPFFVKLKGKTNISFTKSQIPTTKISSVWNKLIVLSSSIFPAKQKIAMFCQSVLMYIVWDIVCTYKIYFQLRWGNFGSLYFRHFGNGICFSF